MAFFAGNSEIGTLALGLVISGVVGGLVAGMLGVGGGIVVVPILYHVLAALGVDPSVRMHVAVGTSLATIIPTSFSSVTAHNKKGAVDWDLLRRWWLPMLVGVLGGSALAAYVRGQTLSLIFAGVALPVALHFAVWGDKKRLADHLPRGIAGLVLPFGIGGVSTMMGIGGG
ncbi:MAG: sulfite exporter TauE/SafE family protein, partial [Alphaproteobacteria bacterium]|nr:sulfite exporter TauE/SafE family protein [Alphaproteobacteria bacterium]